MVRHVLQVFVVLSALFAVTVMAGGSSDKVTGDYSHGNCWECQPGDTLGWTSHKLVSAHEAGVKHPQRGFLLSWRDDGAWFEMDFRDTENTCVRIDAAGKGIQPTTSGQAITSKNNDLLLSHEFVIEGSDFASAGICSTEVKSILKKIGFDPALIRRVAISTYEGEMNVVMHAKRANVKLEVSPKVIEVTIDDEGKGIPDVELAMQQGYTTSTEEMRAMGFGSGMGLPNIKKNTDELNIKSEVGKGTTLTMKFFI